MIPRRTRTIMAISCAIGLATGTLTYLTSHSSPQALLAAGAATSSSFDLLRLFIGTVPERPAADRDTAENDDHDEISARSPAMVTSPSNTRLPEEPSRS
jgi:hypothetical protein